MGSGSNSELQELRRLTSQLTSTYSHRVKKTFAHISITGDRAHDTPAANHYTIEKLKWMMEHHQSENFTRFYRRSDKAPQHFCSVYSWHLFSRLPKLFPNLKLVRWDYGCPGHGKV